MARLLVVDANFPDAAAIAVAAAALRGGQLVAFPTETVYGLGADATNAEAVAAIFAAKGRPTGNPLIVHVNGLEMARAVTAAWPDAATRLAEAFWPGPLTLVLPKHPGLPPAVTAGLDAVGVRWPAHPVARALLEATGRPVAAPSANPYMGVSPTTAAHVQAGLGERVAVILDGGPANVGLESTVLDLTGPVPRVLRPGGLSLARLRAVLGEVLYAPLTVAESAARLSPGLAKRHYAPRARVRLVAGVGLAAAAALGEGRVGVWAFAPPAELGGDVSVVLMPREPEAYAARLYAELHAADAAGLDVLLIEALPVDEGWAAVADRLGRATEQA